MALMFWATIILVNAALLGISEDAGNPWVFVAYANIVVGVIALRFER